VASVNDVPVFISSNKRNAPYPEFSLTIPKLKLDQIKVLVASNDFEENLAQLPGTALPGERGNVFVSGHSSIARSLELKDHRAFFVNLPNIKKGDEVYLDAVGQRYTYEVIGTKIVDPKDTAVINPPDSEGRYLTLMTCVPPGFNTKRLIVLARLKQS
jgi:LPXTG-site transpeptidase (sortase) family protein